VAQLEVLSHYSLGRTKKSQEELVTVRRQKLEPAPSLYKSKELNARLSHEAHFFFVGLK
jgi:hypothetical protein